MGILSRLCRSKKLRDKINEDKQIPPVKMGYDYYNGTVVLWVTLPNASFAETFFNTLRYFKESIDDVELKNSVSSFLLDFMGKDIKEDYGFYISPHTLMLLIKKISYVSSYLLDNVLESRSMVVDDKIEKLWDLDTLSLIDRINQCKNVSWLCSSFSNEYIKYLMSRNGE